MKLNFILSDTTKRATTKALESAVKISQADKFSSVVVIVPETKSIIIEKEVLSLTKNGATANIFVYSFVRLLSRLGGLDGLKLVSKQACIVLIRKIIFDNIDNFVCYKKTAKTVGFAEKIYDTIAQLKSSGISPEDLENSLPNFSEALKMKYTDILLIYKCYEKVLSSGLLDDIDRLLLLKKLAKTSTEISEANVFVVGFDNITNEMQQVLREIAVHAKSITFSSVYFNENRRDKYIQKNELFNKFKHIADEFGQQYVPTFFKTFESGDFFNISNSLFVPEKKVFEPKGNIKVFEAQSKRQEIEFVASTIAKEVQGGKRYKDIGVLACGLEDNSKLIEDTFKRYNIPYFVNKKHDISGHLFVKFLESAFAVSAKHLASEEVVKFVSNPLFCAGDVSAFLNFVKSSGVNYVGFLSEPKFFDESEEEKKEIISIFAKFKDFYMKFDAKMQNCRKICDFLSLCEFIAEYFNVQNNLQEIALKQKNLGEIVESEVTAVVFDKHKKFVEILSGFMSDLEVSANEFLQIYLSGLGQIKLNLSPVSIDCVIVQGDTDGFFGIKDLFVFDAVDGKFPVKLDDTGILLDTELEETKLLTGKTAEPTVAVINSRENFRAYEALLEPSEKLFVSFSDKSESGTATKPAQIVCMLVDLFDKKVFSKTFKPAEFVCDKKEEMELAERIGKFFLDGQGLEKINDIFSKIKLSENFKKFVCGMKFSPEKFEIEGANDLYFLGDKTSVSQIEKYLACPYEFFATYGLRLKENKDAKLSSLDIGTVVHLVVELFAKDISKFEKLEKDEFNAEVDKLVLFATEKLGINIKTNGAVLGLIKTECRKLCKNILEEQSGSSFKISKTEFEFGGENSVFVTLEDGRKISFSGKIDRIDKMGEYVRIVDYKTGDVKSNLASIFYGKKIQLASYLEAVKKLGSVKPAGLFYLPVHSNFEEDENAAAAHYKMQGFLLDDIDVVKHFDSSLSVGSPVSKFVPLRVKENKNGELEISKLGRAGDRLLDEKDFENVGGYVMLLAKNCIEEALSGYNAPSPIAEKSERIPKRCENCLYFGFCGLEKSKFANGRVCNGLVDAESFDTNVKAHDKNEDGGGL